MRVTIQDIARSLNLSHTTVSRALNSRDDPFISTATRDRVWSRAREMGYRPNRAARALVTGRTQQIALWMRHIYTAFHAHVIHEVEQQLRGTDYQMMIGSMEAETESEALGQWQVDGCLLFEGLPRVQAVLAGRSLDSIPLVSMGGTNFMEASIDFVGLDLSVGAEEALEHLAEIGCRRIAYIGEEIFDPRREQYKRFVAQTGRQAEFIDTPNQRRADVRTTVREYVAAHGCPDGLFCFNDDVALGCYRALRDLAVRIPEDAALIGCDGIEDTEYLDTPLSTIVLPVQPMCRTAWQFLRQRIEEPSRPLQQVMLRPTLALRESTRR